MDNCFCSTCLLNFLCALLITAQSYSEVFVNKSQIRQTAEIMLRNEEMKRWARPNI